MKSIAVELNDIIDRHLAALQKIPGDEYVFKAAPGRWSKKEILGHLIDSAQNNIRRFVVAQYEDRPKIVYNQDQWVALAAYQDYSLPDLVSLWFLLNKHLSHVLDHMPADAALREAQTENLHTLEWLAKDYIRHLLHHLSQVLELEAVAYP